MYKDNAVFIPGRGAVLAAEAGTDRPTMSQIKAWLSSGATGSIGDHHPLGYTSIDELPKLDTETEGGEVKGAWENSALRKTATKVIDSLTVSPIQWTATPLKHRFGPGTIETSEGVFEVPSVYTSTEVALLVLFIDGDDVLAMHYPKTATSPEGGIEPSSEDFMAMPIKYTVLNATGKPRMSIIADALTETEDTGVDGGGA